MSKEKYSSNHIKVRLQRALHFCASFCIQLTIKNSDYFLNKN